jgi:AhpD family alkylhydroperoxidase
MDLDEFNERRNRLNARLGDFDDFFSAFGALDDNAYADGSIPARTKELIGLALSVLARCDECVAYHLQSAKTRAVSAQEAAEAVKLGALAGGSVTYPTARLAIDLIDRILVTEPDAGEYR